MKRLFERACFVGLLSAVTTLTSATASANGRFPGATQMVLRGQRGLMTSSFGVITTGDRWTTPGWACERSIGYNPQENNDIGAGIFGDGTMVLAGPVGVTYSTDGACTNPTPAGPLDGLWFSDVTIDGANPSSGLAVSRGKKLEDCGKGQLFESVDNGRSWAVVSDLPNGFCPLTLDSAPSDPKRVYISGNVLAPDGTKLIARLLISDDRGKTFTTSDIPNEARPFIGAIDPKDKDTLYVRTSNPPTNGGLFVSTDGGKNFNKLATLTGLALQFFGVTGLALSPDGAKLAYGSVNEGLFVIPSKGAQPEKRNSLPVMCLRWEDDALYACSAPNLCGPFFVGKSHDEGRSFDTLLSTLDVHGDQSACPASTPQATLCPTDWPTVRAKLAGCTDGGVAQPATDAGAADAGAGVAKPPKLGCDCRFVGADRAGYALAPLGGLVGALAVLAARRRRPR